MSGKKKTPLHLIGKTFGYWTVLSYSHLQCNKHYYFNCKCKCGKEKKVCQDKLLYGGSYSCGCYRSEQKTKNCLHGMSKTRFYGIWNDMMMRCYNPNKERYNCYGARGIKVCKRWHSFVNFKKDMYEGYRKGLSLERKNVNKDYCKRNCTWIPLLDQKLNKQKPIIKLVFGVKQLTVKEASLEYGITEREIYRKKKKGYSDLQCVIRAGTCRTT